MFKRAVLACVAGFACACTSTYHPEYHPVTVTTVHQSVTAEGVPISTKTTANGVTPIVIQQPQVADPDVVFHAGR